MNVFECILHGCYSFLLLILGRWMRSMEWKMKLFLRIFYYSHIRVRFLCMRACVRSKVLSSGCNECHLAGNNTCAAYIIIENHLFDILVYKHAIRYVVRSRWAMADIIACIHIADDNTRFSHLFCQKSRVKKGCEGDQYAHVLSSMRSSNEAIPIPFYDGCNSHDKIKSWTPMNWICAQKVNDVHWTIEHSTFCIYEYVSTLIGHEWAYQTDFLDE